MDVDNGEVNPYRELVVNNAEKIEMQKIQMEQWSILSNSLNYMQHSKFNSMDHSLNVKPVNRYKVTPNEKKRIQRSEFWYKFAKLTSRISKMCMKEFNQI